LPRAPRRAAPPASVGVAEVTMCWPLGLPPDPAAPSLCQRQRQALALVGSLPPTWPEREARLWGSGRLQVKVDAKTGKRLSAQCSLPHESRDLDIARWPSLAYPWLPAAERKASAIPALSADCVPDALDAMETLRIDGPAEGTTLARASNAGKPAQLRLRALGTAGRVRWLVNGAWVADTQGGAGFVHAFDKPGNVRITALADSGAWAELGLHVLR